VDDDEAVRQSLSLLLETAGLLADVYSSAETFLSAFNASVPACLILDVSMPGMSGLELQAELARREISLPIVFLTAHGNIPMTVQAIRNGAINFLVKPVEGKVLLENVEAALLQAVERLKHVSLSKAIRERLIGLSPRELEVMKLIVAGHSNKRIAQLLGISHRTVEAHRSRVMEKSGAPTVMELARLAKAVNLSLE
jgi:FixJ family two-component response regulator